MRLLQQISITLMLIISASTYGDEKVEPTYQGKPVDFWVKRLESDDAKERELAMKAVEAFHKDAAPAVPILLRWLNDRCDEYRHFAADRLRDIGPGAKDHLPDLIAQLKNPDYYVRTRIMWTLEAIGPDAKAAVSPLHVIFFKEKEQKLRAGALDAIAAIDPENADVRATVLGYLQRGPAAVARWEPILKYLQKAGPSAKAAIPSLEKALGSSSYDDKQICITLGRIGEAAVPALLRLSKDKSPELRGRAMKGFAEMGPSAKSLVPALEQMLLDEEPDVGIEAARALWIIDKDEKAMAFFVDRLEADYKIATKPSPAEGDPKGRTWAGIRAMNIAHYLSYIGPEAKSALPALKKWCGLKENPDENYLNFIKDAIEKIENKSEDK